MRKCAVIIGVNKVGTLTPLTAAVKGAKEFQRWVLSQNYDVKLHVDEGGPVEVHHIKDTISVFVDSRVYSLMVIFFAGHGILKSPNEEQWLLSKADRDVGAAINVQQSRLMARITGIPHVVFISDACRSKPENPLIMAVSGTIIFPNGLLPFNSRTKVDMFYATTPGDPSYELPMGDATSGYDGIYTKFLLKGLKGEVPEIIQQLHSPRTGGWGVMSGELDLYLQEVVPLALEESSASLSQMPDGEITSRNPMSLADFDQPQLPVVNNDMNPAEAVLDNMLPSKSDRKPDKSTFSRAELEGNIQNLIEADSHLKKENMYSVPGTSLVTIVGAGDISFMSEERIYQQSSGEHVLDLLIGTGTRGSSLLVIFNDGSIAPVAILSNFDVLLLIEKEQIVNISYSPAIWSRHFERSELFDDNISMARARIAAKARQGKFRIEGYTEELMWEASFLRNFKAFDPTLGLYACYAYAQAGNFDQVRSVYRYMIRDAEQILFDVSMLNSLFSPDFNTETIPSTIFPSLTQGWSYLPIKPELFHPMLRELSSHLKPALWTKFTPEGGRIFQEYLNLYPIEI
ncbi:caspase family protein [Pedobacter heparinus]|uniref:caspase family protein n=1 Tax=Pedobacter heparinus TaxID=984 RepID=UPI002930BEB8|nr:caspase family protein [Pedobacter heparinus]